MGFDKEANSYYNGLLRPLSREDTPLMGKSKPLSFQPKTFTNVFISIVDAGVLGLSCTFMRIGWLTSLIMIFVVAALTYHCMMLLIHTRRKIEFPFGFDNIASFSDLGFIVCGPIGRFAVNTMVILSQAGFCVGYLIFIGKKLANLFSSSSTFTAYLNFNLVHPKIWGISAKIFYIWSCFPFQVELNLIPSLTLLAPLSIFADIIDFGAMGVVLVEDVLIFTKHRPIAEAFGSLSMFVYGLGVAIYSFEGIGMVLPLESEMKDKSKFGKILGLTMLFIALMYGSSEAFGENTKDIITSNLGQGLLSTLVQLGLCFNLFFTFPLTMNPVYGVFERRFGKEVTACG